MTGKSAENGEAKFWLEDGILHSCYKVDHIDLDIAKSGVKLRHEFIKGQSFPLFVDMTNVKTSTKEARDYLAQGEAVDLVKAVAMLTTSYVTVLMVKFFLAFNKPKLPLQLFTSKEDALKWLKKFK